MNTSLKCADPRTLNDAELLSYSLLYGRITLKARNFFIGSLPEVARRALFLKKGFESVFHFAKMTGGVSEEQVRTVLNLARQFENMPNLARLLATGKVSINKLVRITSVVTTENEQYWASQVQQLSKSALEVLVRDHRHETGRDKVQNEDLFSETSPKSPSLAEAINPSSELPGQLAGPSKNTDVKMSAALNVERENALQLDEDVRTALMKLQQKNIDINAELREFLVRREAEIAAEKEKLAEKAESKLIEQITEEKEVSRVVPAATKRLLKREFGTKCAIDRCRNASEEIHHTARFSVSHTHNPYFLAPLCKQHHQIAHARDLRVVEARLSAESKLGVRGKLMV